MNTRSGQQHGIDGHATPEAAREQLIQRMQNAIHEAERWLGQHAEQRSDQDNQGDGHPPDEAARLASTARATKTALSGLEQDLLATTRQAARASDAFVAGNPWKSVGLGAAVGLIAGLLIGRK